MISNNIYPWQTNQWQQLWQTKKANRLPHALLLTGIAGMGKADFADNFTRALLCQQSNSDGVYCNVCHSCRLIAGRVHPNVLWIEPEKEGHVIKVDQIREAAEFISQSGLEGAYQILIIHPAHCMNTNAANALLKTLEEPASGSIIILLSDQSERLPATVLSRCQRINFPYPLKKEALHWLKNQLEDQTVNHELLLNLANGAPLGAYNLVQNELLSVRHEVLEMLSQNETDPIHAAAKIQEIGLLQFLDLILDWVIDLLRLQFSGDIAGIKNSDYKKQLVELMPKREPKNTIQFMDYVQQLRSQIGMGINLNKQLLIEDVLIRWYEQG